MSTHKITAETKVPFPCWMHNASVSSFSLLRKGWEWHKDRPPGMSDIPECQNAYWTHYSTNPKDQPPLGEPAPEGSLPVTNAQYTGKHPKDNATGYDDSPLPTPAAPSLQSVAEEPIVRKGAYDYLAAQYRKLEAALTERDERIGRLERELAMANDAANKGDRARDIADAQDQIIAELRASLQIERETGSALRTRCAELEKLVAEGAAALDATILLAEQHVEAPYKPLKERFVRDRLQRAARKKGQQAHEKGEGA